jgi:hypothetical protein
VTCLRAPPCEVPGTRGNTKSGPLDPDSVARSATCLPACLPALGGFWPGAAVFLPLNVGQVECLVAAVGSFDGSFGVVLSGLSDEVLLDLGEVVGGDEHRH